MVLAPSLFIDLDLLRVFFLKDFCRQSLEPLPSDVHPILKPLSPFFSEPDLYFFPFSSPPATNPASYLLCIIISLEMLDPPPEILLRDSNNVGSSANRYRL